MKKISEKFPLERTRQRNWIEKGSRKKKKNTKERDKQTVIKRIVKERERKKRERERMGQICLNERLRENDQ